MKKDKQNHKRDIELMFEIGCLRFMDRSWKRFGNPDVANNTEHTMRVIWLAILLAKYENVQNIEKVMKMALVHDITESRTGDVDYMSRQYTERFEDKAIFEITENTSFDDFVEVWREYEKKSCIEAKIVKDADNLDIEFEICEQKSKGHNIGRVLTPKRNELVHPKLFTESAKKLWTAIQKSNPDDWHLNGNNRFRSGDWKKK